MAEQLKGLELREAMATKLGWTIRQVHGLYGGYVYEVFTPAGDNIFDGVRGMVRNEGRSWLPSKKEAMDNIPPFEKSVDLLAKCGVFEKLFDQRQFDEARTKLYQLAYNGGTGYAVTIECTPAFSLEKGADKLKYNGRDGWGAIPCALTPIEAIASAYCLAYLALDNAPGVL